MNLPSYRKTEAATGASSAVLPEGEYDFAIRTSTFEERSGLKIMEVEAVVDNGDQAGGRSSVSFMWGDDEAKAEASSARLKLFAESLRTDDGALDGSDDGSRAPGFIWDETLPGWKPFAEQFANRQNGLVMRFRARVYHSIDVKVGSDWIRGKFGKEADKLEQEAKADGIETTRYTKAKITPKSFAPPVAESKLYPATSGDGAATPAPPAPAPSAAAYAPDETQGDDDLPF